MLLEIFKLGLGAADLTREEAEWLVAKARERYGDEIGDGREMVEELLRHAEAKSQKLRQRIKAEVARAVKEQNLVEQKDVRALAANVKALAATTATISKKLAARGAKRAAKTAKRGVRGVARWRNVKKSVGKKHVKTRRTVNRR